MTTDRTITLTEKNRANMTAYAQNTDLKANDIPLIEIYSDSAFNIRGEIQKADIVDLARNINQHGLLQPITVQDYTKSDDPNITKRIIVGHRRYAAFEYLQRETIPAIIKNNLTPVQALAMNFIENVIRKDLNILEEARGIQKFADAGESVENIAKMINKGRNWVKIRQSLLLMPEPIQEDAAAGWLTQAQILDLSGIRDKELQLKHVRAIKEAKGRGEKRLPKIKEKKVNPTLRKKRDTMAVLDMLDHIIDETGVTSPFTRTMAWCNGEISDLDLYRDLMEYFKSVNIPYAPPIEVRGYLDTAPIPGLELRPSA